MQGRKGGVGGSEKWAVERGGGVEGVEGGVEGGWGCKNKAGVGVEWGGGRGEWGGGGGGAGGARRGNHPTNWDRVVGLRFSPQSKPSGT